MTEPSGSLAVAAGLFGESAHTAQQYVDILLSRGIDWGLIGPREADRVWDRHIFNSAALAPLLPNGADVVDVGSGAGLPGIPLALARPDLQVVLLEPLLRRFEFLQGVVAELGLDHVEVVRGRAEDHARTYDVVVARAVAPLERLVGWTGPLLRPGGMLLALKGTKAADEIAASRSALSQAGLTADLLEVRAAPDTETTRVIRVRAFGR